MKVYLIGVGMGNPATMTLAAREAIAASPLLIGAPRLLEDYVGKTCLPLIAATANVFPEDIAATAAAGMDAHVAKPIDFTALRDTLSRLAGRGKGRTGRSPAAMPGTFCPTAWARRSRTGCG